MTLFWTIAAIAWASLLVATGFYVAYRIERPVRPLPSASPPWRPSLPPSRAGHDLELWGVAVCCRCLTEFCHPASRTWSMYSNERPYAQFREQLESMGWQKIGIGIEPSRWHCPDCVASIRLVVYS